MSHNELKSLLHHLQIVGLDVSPSVPFMIGYRSFAAGLAFSTLLPSALASSLARSSRTPIAFLKLLQPLFPPGQPGRQPVTPAIHPEPLVFPRVHRVDLLQQAPMSPRSYSCSAFIRP